MSLFKAIEWWSEKYELESPFFPKCLLCLQLIESHNNLKQIVFTSRDGVIRVIFPTKVNDADNHSHDTCFQIKLKEPVNDISGGNLKPNLNCDYIVVLHSLKLRIISLDKVTEDSTILESQYQLKVLYEHAIPDAAFNMCIRTENVTLTNGSICVQTLRGKVHVYSLDSFIFSYDMRRHALPSHLVYIKAIDAFIFGTFAQHIEAFKYRNLAEASQSTTLYKKNLSIGDTNSTATKRTCPTWVVCSGEPIFAMDAVEDMNNLRALILVLTRRTVLTVSELGIVCSVHKLDANALHLTVYGGCFFSDNDDTSRTTENKDYLFEAKYIIITEGNHLLIFQGRKLLWSAQLPRAPVAVTVPALPAAVEPASLNEEAQQPARFSLAAPAGLMALLSADGWLELVYLGTDPSVDLPLRTGATKLCMSGGLANLAQRDLNHVQVDTQLTVIDGRIKQLIQEQQCPPPPAAHASTEVYPRLELSIQPVLEQDDEPTQTSRLLVRIIVSFVISKTDDLGQLQPVKLLASACLPVTFQPNTCMFTAEDRVKTVTAEKASTFCKTVEIFLDTSHCLGDSVFVDPCVTFAAMFTRPDASQENAICPSFVTSSLTIPAHLLLVSEAVDHKEATGEYAIRVSFSDNRLRPDRISLVRLLPNLAPSGASVLRLILITSKADANHDLSPVFVVGHSVSGRQLLLMSDLAEAILLPLQTILSRVAELARCDGISGSAAELVRVEEAQLFSSPDALDDSRLFASLRQAFHDHVVARAQLVDIAAIIDRKARHLRAVQRNLIARVQDRLPVPLKGMDVLLEAAIESITSSGVEAKEAVAQQMRTGARAIWQLQLLLLTVPRELNAAETGTGGLHGLDGLLLLQQGLFPLLESTMTLEVGRCHSNNTGDGDNGESCLTDAPALGLEEALDAALFSLLQSKSPTSCGGNNALVDLCLSEAPANLTVCVERIMNHLHVLLTVESGSTGRQSTPTPALTMTPS